jgi:S1-C subfamily serine protease
MDLITYKGGYIMKLFLMMTLFIVTSAYVYADDQPISSYLQNISVTIKTDRGSGSGVIFTRAISSNEGEKKVNFVWTAAHVLENIRSVKTVLDSEGKTLKIPEFKDVQIVKKLIENGTTVGELSMDAIVVKYSDAKDGEDLALLMIKKFDFVGESVRFYNDTTGSGLSLGTQLYHVGSLLGEDGANSMTTGIVSQVGRMLSLNGGSKVLFDQTTVTAFPGSSGGGVFLTNGDYVGMLVRGAGETFNLMVPVRRMSKWASSENLNWAMDQKIKAPTLEEIVKLPKEKLGSLGVCP